ncbi:MAG: hypothetical protein ACYS9V_15155 [Planctomycetota bacterium]
MKDWKVLILLSMVLVALTSLAGAGETLYNGIVLPDEWPPRCEKLTRDPMPVPYLENRPQVVPIDVGRQLFVDDFLIETTTLQRTFHQPEYCSKNPVIEHSKPGEKKSYEVYAAPFSGGVCYDPADKLFKLWYTRVRPHATCYATSKDGIGWVKPKLDIEGGTNIVINPERGFNSTAIMLDQWTKNPNERFKYFATEYFGIRDDGGVWGLGYRISADGIHWSEPMGKKLLQSVSQSLGSQPAYRGLSGGKMPFLPRSTFCHGTDEGGYTK